MDKHTGFCDPGMKLISIVFNILLHVAGKVPGPGDIIAPIANYGIIRE